MTHDLPCRRAVRAAALLLGVSLGSGVAVLPAAGQNAPAANAPDSGAAAAAAVRSQIEAAYAQISQAFRRKDAPGVMAFATPDFQVRTPGGRVLGRAQAQQNVQQNLDTIRSVKANRYTINRITVRAESAVCHVTERSLAEFNDSRGEFGPIGKSHALAVTTTYRDTWVRRSPNSNGNNGNESRGDGAWRLKRSEMRSSRILLDGRPYRPSRTQPERQP